jgi:DNA-binding response OmpR family regulator
MNIIEATWHDLIIIDINRPGIDGFSVARQIRKMRPDQQPLILMLTARGDKHDQLSGLECGAP